MMEINPKIFKAYDIRGVYGKDFDMESFYYIGNAFAAYLDKIQPRKDLIKNPQIVVGRDVRESSDDLCRFFAKGVLDYGFDVLDIGQVTTPMFSYGVAEKKAFGGAMVTGSHNPAEYNGIKLVKEMARWVGDWVGDKELQEVLKTVISKKKVCKFENESKSYKIDISEDYLNRVTKDFKIERKLKIVVDASGGSTALFLPKFFQKLNVFYSPLFFEVDPQFKKHNPNPSLPESQKFVKEKIKEIGADFGIIFDADGDRMVVVDEKLQVLRGDVCGGVIADSFLKPGDTLLYDVISSRAIKDYFEKNQIKTIRGKVGHYYIKKAMEEHKADFALEMSSHFYFKDMNYVESAFYALRYLLSALDEASDLAISDLAKPFLKYHDSGVINIEIDSKNKWFEILEKLKKKYKEGKQSFEDGILVEYGDFWFSVRPSNTEPVMRFIVEADTEEILEKRQKEILSLIK